MDFIKYIKQSKIYILLVISVTLIVNLNIVLDANLKRAVDSLSYINLLIFVTTIIFIVIGYFSEKRKYNDFFNYVHNKGDKKETLKQESLYEVIDEKIMEYEEEVEGLKNELKEINDYMTNSIHQIKIPIAVLEIISKRIYEIENGNNLSKEINIELKRIENLVEQALYNSRAGNYNSDFLIEEVNLEKIIKDVIKKNKQQFIYNKISIETSNLDCTVFTDKKWISHIIEQILDNSCKYTETYGKIEIYTIKYEKGLKLHIKDNGIGIVTQDIERIFDKGFTGENGRKRTKSTGMGLYISKKILNKLSHDIYVTSKSGEYCNVCITFYNLLDYFNVT